MGLKRQYEVQVFLYPFPLKFRLIGQPSLALLQVSRCLIFHAGILQAESLFCHPTKSIEAKKNRGHNAYESDRIKKASNLLGESLLVYTRTYLMRTISLF